MPNVKPSTAEFTVSVFGRRPKANEWLDTIVNGKKLIETLDDGKPHELELTAEEVMKTVLNDMSAACKVIDRSLRTQMLPKGATVETARTALFQVIPRIVRPRTPKGADVLAEQETDDPAGNVGLDTPKAKGKGKAA